MKDICPNCGAAITDEKCPYCGSMFFDFACIDMDKPCFVKFKWEGKIFRAKCLFSNFRYEHSMDRDISYADDGSYFIVRPSDPEITLNFRILPDENGMLALIVNTKEVSKDARPW